MQEPAQSDTSSADTPGPATRLMVRAREKLV